MASRGLKSVSGALAAADVVAHLAFLAIFGWRSVASFGPMKVFAGFFAALALVGLLLAFVGRLLVKHGGRTPAAKVGHGAVAASTGLAALLLLLASWTSG
jgi:hypothetical protein